MALDSRVPSGPIEKLWDQARFEMKLVNPANKRKHTIIVVGSGLAGGSAAATLGELGYNVKCFCFQDSPRRAHSIAAQGGINAAKNYQNDGDSIFRLVLRHGKGRRFPLARSQRLPAGADQRQHHRPMRRARRAVRARIRRHAVEPLVRWRAGFANLLRSRTDGAAVAAGRVSGAGTAGGRRPRDHVPAHRDARPDRDRRQGARHRHAQSGHGQNRVAPGRCGRARHRRLRQRLLSFDQRERFELPRRSGARTRRARRLRIPASRRSIRRAFRFRAIINRS